MLWSVYSQCFKFCFHFEQFAFHIHTKENLVTDSSKEKYNYTLMLIDVKCGLHMRVFVSMRVCAYACVCLFTYESLFVCISMDRD